MNDALVIILERDATELARETVDSMEARDPDLFTRYGARGRTYCLEDTIYHLQHLAAALSTDDIDEFRSYRGWLVAMLGARGIAGSDIQANFAAIADVLSGRLGAGADRAVAFLHVIRGEELS